MNQEFGFRSDLYESEEFKRIQRIETFKASFYIFQLNYAELRTNLFALCEQDDIELHYVVNRHKLDQMFMEITRFLHNFVSATLSLIDHTRVLYRSLYEPKGSIPEYQTKVDQNFAKHPLTQFVIGLRQYFQHYQIPNIGVSFSFDSENPDFVSSVRLENCS